MGQPFDAYETFRAAIRLSTLRSLFGERAGSRADEVGAALQPLIELTNVAPQLLAVHERLNTRLWQRAMAARAAVGVDVSARSLAHLRSTAEREVLPISTVHGSYLDVDLGEGHDGAILIYEDYSALSPEQRGLLLRRVRSALRPGAPVVFDVTAAPRFEDFDDALIQEINLGGGFWAPEPYVGTKETWTYPELRLVLERYLIEKDGERREFWNWMHCLPPDQVAQELSAAGFAVEWLFADVTGAPFDEDVPSFAVLAQAL